MSKVVHFEIPVDDPARAQAFYAGVFDWKISGWGDQPYWLVEAGPEDEQGADGALIARSDVHTAPVVIIDVDDVDAAIARAESEGATLVTGRTAVPGMGWSAYLRDPEGNVIGLWHSDSSAS